jgi:hypothetical protein
MFIFNATKAEGDTIFCKKDTIVAIYTNVFNETSFVTGDDIEQHISELCYDEHKDYLENGECIDTLTDGTKVYFLEA